MASLNIQVLNIEGFPIGNTTLTSVEAANKCDENLNGFCKVSNMSECPVATGGKCLTPGGPAIFDHGDFPRRRLP